MRNLFLLLVLLNLGVLAWFSWIAPEPERPAAWSGTSITLLRELDANAPIVAASRSRVEPSAASSDIALEDPALAAQTVPSGIDDTLSPASVETSLPVDSEGSAASAASCVAVGPFTEAAQADTAVATLNEAGIAASLHVEQTEVWEGYWVYVAGLPSTQRANAALAELAANGIADAYVIPNSDSGILISLGVFSDVTRAGAQAERAGRFGLSPTITERIRTEETRWIELEFDGEESQALGLLQQPGVINRLEQRECRGAPDASAGLSPGAGRAGL